MVLDYNQIISDYRLNSAIDINNFFIDYMVPKWLEIYQKQFYKAGDITLQEYYRYKFLFDDTSIGLLSGEQDVPDPRVIAAFGFSHVGIGEKNRRIMRNHPPASEKFGNKYDRGHFIAHMAGGPIDINLFPQRRAINRGWSKEGKRYRAMEKYITLNSGTFAFSRPIYDDLSYLPLRLEYGYYNKNSQITFEVFPNK